MRRTRRREREEEPQPSVEEVPIDPEELELEQFLDSVGGQGIAEVFLYRLLPSGKQRYVDSGPVQKFTEQFVQATYGAGDYLVRSKLNGRWYRSKSFSVESLPGATVSGPVASHDSEFERLKMEFETQRVRLEQ